jgi:hypothetical protein
MKIYIWNEPYQVSWGGSFLFIAAESEEQARLLAAIAPKCGYGYRASNDKPLGNIELGPPSRVIDVPGGECYWWSE